MAAVLDAPGLCQCGCGGEAGVYRKQAVRGQPRKFIYGHNARKPRVVVTEKECSACGLLQPADGFYADSKRCDGLFGVCKECHKARSQAFASAHPEIMRASNLSHTARKKGCEVVEQVIPMVVLERDDGICGICLDDVDPFDYTIDHIVPHSKGGEHSYDNVQLAHRVCNSRKHDRLLERVI